MPYNASTGIITAPVSIRDVQRAVGNSSPDLKTLCRQQSIKQWARFRPIEYRPGGVDYVQGPITDAQRATVNYGIGNIPVWRGKKTLANMVNFWVDGDTTATNRPNDFSSSLPVEWWTMVLPTSVARLTDFVSGASPTTKGYYTDAEPPIGQLVTPVISFTPSGYATIEYPMGLNGVTAGLTITYSDLSVMTSHSYSQMYFGIVIKAGSTIYIATQENVVGPQPSSSQSTVSSTLWSMGASVHIKADTSSGALISSSTAKVFPVICATSAYAGNTAIRAASSNRQDTYIALHEAVTATINITYAKANIRYFTAWKNSSQSSRLIYYSWTIANQESDNSRTFNVLVEIIDSSGSVVGTSTTRTVTVSGGGSQSYDGSIDAQSGGVNVYSLATQLRMTVSLATTDTAVFKSTDSKLATIASDFSPLA